MYTHLLYILLTLQATLALHWNADVGILVTERLDPIISPNAIAQHMHTILGGSAFGASYNYADQVQSGCTTFPVSVDKSNYWAPSIYWINNGSFTPIRTQNHVYYFIDRPSPATPITSFPEGIRIIAGNPMAKSAVPNYVEAKFHCRTDPNNFDAAGDVIQDNFNIGQDCPAGLLIEIHFPSCWDGVNLYKSDQSHMAYPTQSPFFGQCPWSHPIRLPGIMIEVYAMTSEVAPGKALSGNLAWANGDTTGYGVHGDFTNGWDIKILGQALNDSRCTSSDMRFVDCAVFQPYVQGGSCTPQKGVMKESPEFQFGVSVPSLPGCNPLWGPTGPKPTCSTPPFQPNVAPFQGTDGSLAPSNPATLPLPTTPGWTQVGCIADGNDPNALLEGSTRFYDPKMTQDNCLNSCLRSGFSYAAVGFAWGSQWACTCGTAVDPDAWAWPGMCNLTCPGTNASCGGSGAHSVFYAPQGTTVASGSSTSNLGCYVDSSDSSKPSLEGTATYSFTDWNAMTQPFCLQECANRGLDWAGLKNGATCYCGSLSTFSLGGGSWVSPNLCSTNCTGNSSQTCGTWNGMNVFNVTASGYTKVNPDKPEGYVECYSDGGGNALNGPRWTDGSNSPQRCTYGCAEVGYSYASVWNSNVCLCGNSFDNKFKSLPSSSCSNACPGSSSNMTCGGPGNGELYKTSGQAAAVAQAKAARPVSWQGCYPNNNGNSIPADLVVGDGAQSVEKCMATCTNAGMPFAALGNGWQCRCSKSDPRGSIAPVPASIFCTQTCNGASNETCGGSNSLDIYSLAAPSSNTSTTTSASSTSTSSSASSSRSVVSSSVKPSSSSKSAASSGKASSSKASSSKGATTSSAKSTSTSKSTSSLKSSSSSKSTSLSTAKSTSPSASKTSSAGSSKSTSGATKPAVGSSSKSTSAPSSASKSTTPSSKPSSSSAIPLSSSSAAMSSSSSSGPISTATSSTQSSASSVPTNVALSCASDVGTLNGAKYSSSYMTNDVCVYWCIEKGFAQAGVQGNTCYCGNTRPSVSSDGCTSPCQSNSAQMCGGTKAVSLFSTSDLSNLVDPAKPSDPTGYIGCWKDSSSRLLRGFKSSSGSMTNQMCAQSCATRGYSMSGTENGRECYCGSEYEGGLYRVADSECSNGCVGNKSQRCGGAYRLSVYDSKTASGGSGSSNTPGKRRYRCSPEAETNCVQNGDRTGQEPGPCPV